VDKKSYKRNINKEFIISVMSWYMSVLLWLWTTFKEWLSIFIAPLKDFNMLWIIIPIYLNWIFTDIYQEKKGTSLGNAISNGVVVLWVGIDWSRTVINQGILSAGWTMFLIKMAIALLAFAYGLIIIIEGIKVKNITHYIGRIREVTYFCLMFTPIFYGVVKPTFTMFIAIILFFPVFYGIVELIARVTPNPKTYEEEAIEKEFDKGLGDFGMNEPFGGKQNIPPAEPFPTQQQNFQQQNFNPPFPFNK